MPAVRGSRRLRVLLLCSALAQPVKAMGLGKAGSIAQFAAAASSTTVAAPAIQGLLVASWGRLLQTDPNNPPS
jgi:hypothetical protein